MARLGSKKNPLILRVSDESEIERIAGICDENDWWDLSRMKKRICPIWKGNLILPPVMKG